MCTIAILLDSVADAPLVVAANRDELYARPTRSPEQLGGARVAVAGGIDVTSGGTWLALRADGGFAAVTNQRALSTPPPGLRSRGLIVRELATAEDPDAYVAAIDPTRYASMNLVWGDARGVSVAYLRQSGTQAPGTGEGTREILRLGAGIHVLCNDRIGAAGFPRAARLRAAIEGALAAGVGWPALVAPLTGALADHTRTALAEVPPSHLPPALGRELTATCIHSEHYGTRSSTIFAAAPGRVIDYLHADGPPCTARFADRRGLLVADGDAG